MKTKLPEKLSDLILVALADLEAIEQLPKKYKIDMTTWHKPNGQCSVCFAGAVMARTLHAPIHSSLEPRHFDDYTSKRLSALDSIRDGSVCCGLAKLNGESNVMDGLSHSDLDDSLIFDATDYEDDPEAFKTEMVLTAYALKALGL